MDPAIALLAFVTLQRFVEFIWDSAEYASACAPPAAVEFGGLHYPAMMLVHAAWLAGLWVLGYDRPGHPRLSSSRSCCCRSPATGYWRRSGRRVDDPRHGACPGPPSIESGPYRLMRHPNYAIRRCRVGRCCRWPSGLPLYALVSVVLYVGTALLRVQVENSALAWAPAERARDRLQSRA